ncbi:protein disulphide isomerase [Theileria orientalis strain Shintoku]|uniref:Protein disulphide isomerase n=1 Tax=Theileria orientalis strain Shintoku TaxID=869250 RepID=J4DPR6_THEOR|nr:protein disulphide isomerase [Theileria orientalis strain Shintoku]BAM41169.1 protein disulphide isomerase [Theileria orientalis strain Shintoku]|eukprot:XP_009691470.1 protein disulphide isomerase [Theileria orientalis strain Shintoku]
MRRNFMCKTLFLYSLFSLTNLVNYSKIYCDAKAEQDHVKALTDETFDKFISQHKLVMVKFYADWCVHCKSMAPEYAQAAKTLHEEKSEVVLAKVRNEEGQKLMEKYSVRGFPTVYFFKNGTELEFNGSRDAKGIVDWVKEMSKPGVTFLEDPSALPTDYTYVLSYTNYTLADAESQNVSALYAKYLKESDKYRAYAKFYNLESTHKDASSWNKWRKTKEWEHWKTFSKKQPEWHKVVEALEKKEEEYKNKELKEEYVVYHPGEGYTRFEGSTEEELEKFLAAETLDLFSEIYQENYMFYLSSGLDLGWFCGTKEDYEKHKEVFRKVGRALRHQSTFVWVDSEKFTTIKEVFVLTELPALAYQTASGRYLLQPNTPSAGKTYSFSTFEKVLEFYHDVKTGTVPKSVRSEEEPKDNTGPVKVVVGNTLEKLFTEKKNVLLMIHAPHCQHCKSFLPVYEEFATTNKDNDSLIFASFNGDANESSVDEVNWEAFPTLLYFKAGERVPVKFSGERTAEGLREFVVQNGGLVHDVHTEL